MSGDFRSAAMGYPNPDVDNENASNGALEVKITSLSDAHVNGNSNPSTQVQEVVGEADVAGQKEFCAQVPVHSNGNSEPEGITSLPELQGEYSNKNLLYVDEDKIMEKCPSSKLHAANTMPSETISLILDDTENGVEFQQVLQREDAEGKGLTRTNTAPSLSCLDSNSAKHELARLATEKNKSQQVRRLSSRKKRKLIRRLGSIKNDGTVEIDELNSFKVVPRLFEDFNYGEGVPIEEDSEKKVPPLQIAMLIVGTRGDIQPFVAIGKELQKHGHRVRLATHENFRDFVKTAGLEFFPLGGDPKVLAGYMVKNKGFLPSGPKEIKVQRKQIKSIIYSLYPACTEADRETLVPFKAEAIISNPPAYGHVHVAEALGVPIHIYFTMPWTPTNEFPHPLSRIKSQAGYKLSYQVVDTMIWLGIRGLINDFRKKKLKLKPISYLNRTQGSIADLPTCYLWSPHLVPKPKDWGPRIDVAGYCFLDLASDYTPPEELVEWLHSGSKPIYVGFGSLPVEDPEGMMKIIVEAMVQTNQRGIIDKGWSGIGALAEVPSYIHLIENCPHDWLFTECAAVVHHGGAGTTAAGLKAACPTTVVPFFGDQPFWGERVHEQGIGPAPIPVAQFSLQKLVAAINFMMQPEVRERGVEVAKQIEEEDGVGNAVKGFHRHLPDRMPQTTTAHHLHPLSPQPTCFANALGTFKNMLCY